MSYLSLILRTPGLPVAAVSLLLLGAYSASIQPFQSLIAIREIGLSEPGFALVLALASAVAVTASVLLGILGDRLANRKRLALLTSCIGTLGMGLMVLMPGKATFIFCHGVAVPVTSSLIGQYFALARLALTHRPEMRAAVVPALRACLSAAFLAALLVWTGVLRDGSTLMQVYGAALVISAATTLAIARGWPPDGAAHWQDLPSGLNLKQAFGEILSGPIVVRMIFMGAMTSVATLNTALVGLTFAVTPGRQPGDEALYLGLGAGWEVPVMLTLPLWGRGIRRSRLMALGGMLYALHLVLLQVMAGAPFVWGLTCLGGSAGAVFFCLQIGYLQDLLRDRPGTAVALLAVQKLVGDLMASAAFAIGAVIGGYQVTALIGGALGCIGAAGLMVADRHAEPGAAR